VSVTASTRGVTAYTIDIFMDGDWAGAGTLSEAGRIEHCNAVLTTSGDLDEIVTACEEIEAAIAQGSAENHVCVAGHDYVWSLGAGGGLT
jgi:hypothetical protein